MKPLGVSARHHQVLSRLSLLPRKILALYGEGHVSEFVLHELCNKQCFDMLKAAYFVDNPDFDCLRGVAGYSQEEHAMSLSDEFQNHLSGCGFNQKVQNISRRSYKRAQKPESAMRDIADELKISNPFYYSWSLKHDNHGVLIYEMGKRDNDELHDCIENGLHLLGFCPFN
jgi:hypothetical protein